MRRLSLLVAATCFAAAQDTSPFFEAGKLRVLILSGRNNHEWQVTTPYMRGILADSGRFDVHVNEEPAGITAATLEPYHAVLLDYNGPRWGPAAERALEEFVRAGKGLVVVHGASYGFGTMVVLARGQRRTELREPPWPEFARMTGCRWTEGPPRSGHGRRHVFQVKFSDRDHPIARGMPESFTANDELYHQLVMEPGVKVLATAYDAPEQQGTGKDEPILWTVAYGKGRVFHTTLGHDLMAMREPGFRATLARGTEWAASGAVTLPATIPHPGPAQDAIRVLLVTGGHDHDPDLYSVFTGVPYLRVNVNPHPTAFNRDLRKPYDVIVLYDLVQEIPEAQRTNLRAFLESGKGLVVLHHAVADYNRWEWWWRDVVGGKYQIEKDGEFAASSFHHDQEIRAWGVADHPILRGVGPLHLIDETYKGVWLSPKIQPLLRTDHPLADGVLAWVGPYEKSRVVVILLGHDRQAHHDPGFQQLVRNAVRWTAGRME